MMFLETAKESFAVSFYIMCFLFLGPVVLFSLLYILFCTQYWMITVCYAVYWLSDLRTPSSGGYDGSLVDWCRRWNLWCHFASYFPTKLVKTCDLDPSKNYIIGSHPHGVLCFGAAACFGSEAENFSSLFPGIKPRLTTLEGNLLMPAFREFFMSVGTISSSRSSLNNILSRVNGQAPVLMVGGVPEMHNACPNEIQLFLTKRKGFVKMALKHGANLVPSFVFGETALYCQDGFLARQFHTIATFMKIHLGIAPVIFTGKGWMQNQFGILPQRNPIKVVVGNPIHVDQVDDPSDAQINELHDLYVTSLRDLYNDHNEEPQINLVIL